MSHGIKRPWASVYAEAQALQECLAPLCQRVEIAGSLRRRTTEVSDIEIVALPAPPGRVTFGETVTLDRWVRSNAALVTRNGDRYKQFQWPGAGSVIDLFICTPETWAVNLMIRTGSADFTRWMVTARSLGGACPAGFTFKDARLHHGPMPVITPEEEDVFLALGLQMIPPEKRVSGFWHQAHAWTGRE